MTKPMNRQVEKDALRLLAKLGEAHGAAGYEDSVRTIFQEEVGAGVYTDKMGNVFYEKQGNPDSPRVMLTAHMDEVGFVVQSVSKGGLIRFMPLGGWWSHTLLAHRVRIRTRNGNEVIGVIGAKPPHLLNKNERERLMSIEDMFIDVGAASKEEVLDRFQIGLGDPIVPDSTFTRMSNPDFLLCKGFDNRVGMAIVIQTVNLLKDYEHACSVYAVGTVQEEVGVRGAQTAVFGANPDLAIVLEGSPADDLPSVNEDERQGVLGQGVQIRLMDPSAIMHRKLTQHLIDLADTLNIPYQVAVRKSGGTDARAIHLHSAGVPTAVLGVPARYIHTHNGIVHLEDYASTLTLVVEFLRTLDRETVNKLAAFDL